LLFHTHEFLVLLALTAVAFRALPRMRREVLLASSLLFYAYAGLGMFLLFAAVVGFNWYCYGHIREGAGRGWLAAAIAIDLANLAFFKYTLFFLGTLADLGLELAGPRDWVGANVILPVGISFYTFQLIALLVDSYRGGSPRAGGFVEFFLFVTFFGQLIAGPIMRGSEFLPQLRQLRGPTADQLASGIAMFAIGLLKKVLLADWLLAPRIEELFANPLAWDTPTSWFLGVLFGFQIYYDFSGYCDMAVGLGRLFGLELRVNFSTPYVSRSPSEFWSRWNITLSRWFGDYVYIPLGGSKVALSRTVVNLMLTMLVSGLWHGAGFAFVVWGGLHGLGLALYHAARARFPSLRTVASGWGPGGIALWASTYVLAVVAWVYFRADSIGVANAIVAQMFGFGSGAMRGPLASYAVLSAALLAAHFLEWRLWLGFEPGLQRGLSLWQRIPGPAQALLAFPLIFGVIGLTKKVQGAFIYFQF
jgi:alginate O-acetyltransferase complex protein AlgI